MGKIYYPLRSEVTDVFCSNHSVKYAFSVPALKGNSCANILLCERDDSARGLCGEVLRSIKCLALNGSLVLDVPTSADNRFVVRVWGNIYRPMSQKEFDFHSCISTTYATTVSAANSPDSAVPNTIPGSNLVLVVSLLLLFLVVVCAAIYFCRRNLTGLYERYSYKNHRSSSYNNGPLLSITQRDGDVINARTVSVYIVFVGDNDHHQDTVLKFANFLQVDLGFKVIFEMWEQQKVAENYCTWMNSAMKRADKIIVIWSPEATRRFQSQNFENDMFGPVVQHIKDDLFKRSNVTKYFFVTFDYGINDSFPSDQFAIQKKFNLMKDFEELYFLLQNMEKHQPGSSVNSTKVKDNCYYQSVVNREGNSLKTAIDTAREYASKHPWVSEKDTCTAKTASSGESLLQHHDFMKETDLDLVEPTCLSEAVFDTKRNEKLPPIAPVDHSNNPEEEIMQINKKQTEFPVMNGKRLNRNE